MKIYNQQSMRWLPVIMYHRVVDVVNRPDPHHLCISTADFEAQIAYLSKRGYQAIPLEEVPSAIAQESTSSQRVAITFDDGYMDTYTHAFPILKKYGMIGTIMLVSDCIGDQNAWDEGRAESVPLLSLSEIRELRNGGMRFGAHGAVHASLPDIGAEAVRRELACSKESLEAILGQKVLTLAYPFGRSTAEIRHIAEEVGFSAAFGVDQRTHSLFNYSRIDAARCRGNTLLWRLKVSGIYHRLRQHGSLRMLHCLRTHFTRQDRLWTRRQAKVVGPSCHVG